MLPALNLCGINNGGVLLLTRCPHKLSVALVTGHAAAAELLAIKLCGSNDRACCCRCARQRRCSPALGLVARRGVGPERAPKVPRSFSAPPVEPDLALTSAPARAFLPPPVKGPCSHQCLD
eukprot:366100-Chlamydomonas_euryale.AAC.2